MTFQNSHGNPIIARRRIAWDKLKKKINKHL